MRARARVGEVPIIHVAEFNGMAIQAPPMRARPDFFGPAAIANGRAWAMARPASPMGWINAHGSAIVPNDASLGIHAPYAPWGIPRPLAQGGGLPQWGPHPIPDRPERALPPAMAPPEGASGLWDMRPLHPLYARWNWPAAYGNAGPNARSFGWRPIKR